VIYLCNYVGKDKVKLWGVLKLIPPQRPARGYTCPEIKEIQGPVASQCHPECLSYGDNSRSGSGNLGFTLIAQREEGRDLPIKTS